MTERFAYRVTEVAEALGCSRDTVDRLVVAGSLKSFNIKTARFVSADELRRFVREQEEAAGDYRPVDGRGRGRRKMFV